MDDSDAWINMVHIRVRGGGLCIKRNTKTLKRFANTTTYKHRKRNDIISSIGLSRIVCYW